MSMEISTSLMSTGTAIKNKEMGIKAIKLQNEADKQVVGLIAEAADRSKANAPKPSGSKGQIVDINV